MPDDYDARYKRVYDALNHVEPDTVPTMSMIETYAIGYSNTTVDYILSDWSHEVEVFCKPYDRLYADCAYTSGTVLDSKFAELIGSPAHFVSSDGQTIQHLSETTMEADEYDQLIADPEGFMTNVLLPRKAKRLAGTTDEKRAAVFGFLKHLQSKRMVWDTLRERYKDEYSMPVMSAGRSAYPPMDFLFDYLRGFKGTSMDMQRQPEKMIEGINALAGFLNKMLGIPPNAESLTEHPPYATMFHAPTFLSPQQFERFFAPTYDRMVERIDSLGGKLILFLEGSWKTKYDWINRLPRNMAFCILEDDDIFEAKKLIGDNVCLVGGMPLGLLKYGSTEECKEYAKRLIDVCAPGGGYMFSTSKSILSAGDINFENLVATHEFVHEYGKK